MTARGARGDFRRLDATLRSLDGRGYKAYREIQGLWEGEGWLLHVEHVQGDPFATPSRLRLRLPERFHAIPREVRATPLRRVGLCDYLLRSFAQAAARAPRLRGMGNSGRILVDAGRAEMLARSGCFFDGDTLELRFRAGLPAAGRTVLGREASRMLVEFLPRAVSSLQWSRLDQTRAWSHAAVAEDHAHVQQLLEERNWVAFVADGAVLPRASGVSWRPLEGAVPFRSPDGMRVEIETLHHGVRAGMAIPAGVTLITGGGFHGKTTLLEAVQFGVYPHVPGDGREWVVSRRDLAKVRSEDGRSVSGVDLRPFIHDLPGGLDTAAFSTQDASGSTSLAAAILEALELGASALLLDEDTSATNLLIRDARMQALVRRETITPLMDRVRELRRELGVSTVLVVGGSGDYLDVADTVILMEDFLPQDATERARRVAAEHPTGRSIGDPDHPMRVSPRRVDPRSLDPRRGRKDRVRGRGVRELQFGEDQVDLTSLEQLVDPSQVRAVGVLLQRLAAATGPVRIREAVEALVREAEARGLGALDPSPELALPRRHELGGALNRLRSLRASPEASSSGG